MTRVLLVLSIALLLLHLDLAAKQLTAAEQLQSVAEKYVKKALTALEPLPDSDYKRLLLSWANFMVKRDY